MSKTAFIPAEMSAIPLSDASESVPEWIHLLPAPRNGRIETQDSRGPYLIADQQAIIDTTFARSPKVPVDINHSIHRAAKAGQPSPAVGWVTEMQAREDGIWGKVDWSAQGEELLQGKAYRGISPVIAHDKAKRVGAITAVSLINTPNLRGLTALHSEETDMAFSQKLAKLLGLEEGASEEDILEAAQSALGGSGEDGETEAAQSALDQIAPVLGLKAGASVDDIVEAAQSKVEAADAEVEALQATVKELGGTITELSEGRARDKAEVYVDGEMKKGRVGLNAKVRDTYVSMHMEDPKKATTLIEAMPILTGELPMVAPQSSSTLEDKTGEQIATQAQELIAKRAQGGITLSFLDALSEIEGGTA